MGMRVCVLSGRQVFITGARGKTTGSKFLWGGILTGEHDSDESDDEEELDVTGVRLDSVYKCKNDNDDLFIW